MRSRALPFITVALAGAGLIAGSARAGRQEHGRGSAPRAAPPPATVPSSAPQEPPVEVNAVRSEMLLLTEAMRDVLTMIANNQLGAIPGRVQAVHAAREATEAAIESGRYTLPKNPGKLSEFKKLDEAFHRDLERLVDMTSKKDAQAVARQYGTLVRACAACHAKFRS